PSAGRASVHLEVDQSRCFRPRRRARPVQIEPRRGGDVVAGRAVAVREPVVMPRPDAQALYRDPEVLGEPDRVGEVPAIHPETLLTGVEAVRAQHLVQAEIRRGERGVPGTGDVEVPGTAEVVLGPGTADGGELVVAVEVELHLALAPPAGVVDAPRQVGADVVTSALHAVEQRVHLAAGDGVAAPPLRVQVAGVVGNVVELVVDLVVEDDLGGGQVLQGDPGRAPERHRPVRVEPAVRVRRHRYRTDLAEDVPAVAEEVTERDLDGGFLFAVPVDAQQRTPPRLVRRGGAPDVGDGSRAVDLAEHGGFTRGDVDRGGDLPPLAQSGGRSRAGAFGRHATCAFRAGEVLGRDRAGDGGGAQGDAAEAGGQTAGHVVRS